MKLLRHLPNALTSGNLLCGCMGILSIQNQSPEVAAYFVWAACVFDFFDGFAARALKVSSPIGKELDSLADMVSFGVLPACLMYSLLNATGSQFVYVALLLAVSAALRLAKFNIDENQKDSFMGLPTPANALFITSLIFLPAPLNTLIAQPVFLILITLIFAALSVAPIELFALKFRNFAWADNRIRFTFLALSVLFLVLMRAGSIPFIILLYIVISLFIRVSGVQKNQ